MASSAGRTDPRGAVVRARTSEPAPPGPGDIQPVAHELRDRTITGLVIVVPMLALGVAGWHAWEGLLRPGDLAVFAILYVATGLGVTVGFHRHLTHRSFKA